MIKQVSRLLGALLYGAALISAIPASAADLAADDIAALKDARAGDMRKLVFHDEARPRNDEVFRDRYGNPFTVGDFAGKIVVVNFWATWCPPCRAEMPGIDRLAGDLGGSDFEVLTISTDRGGIERVAKFFDSSNFPDGYSLEHLDLFHDRTSKVARRAGILGLPVTLILDREGREIARLQGEAEWDSADAKALLTRIVEMTSPET